MLPSLCLILVSFWLIRAASSLNWLSPFEWLHPAQQNLPRKCPILINIISSVECPQGEKVAIRKERECKCGRWREQVWQLWQLGQLQLLTAPQAIQGVALTQHVGHNKLLNCKCSCCCCPTGKCHKHIRICICYNSSPLSLYLSPSLSPVLITFLRTAPAGTKNAFSAGLSKNLMRHCRL